jgi:anti-sigma factor RsiW
MNDRRRYLLEQSLDDALAPDERDEFEALLRSDASYARQFERERRMHRMTADAAPRAFDAGFADRVMGRLREAPNAALRVDFDAMLMRLWRRLAPVPLTVAVVLAGYNAYVGPRHLGAGASLVELLFGLPPVTLDMLLGL